MDNAGNRQENTNPMKLIADYETIDKKGKLIQYHFWIILKTTDRIRQRIISPDTDFQDR